MRALQREVGLFFVIEQGRLPFFVVVTLVTIFGQPCSCKLSAMNVGVTADAGCRRGLERNFADLAPRNTRLMALVALDFCVRSNEGKRRFRMVEARKIRPRLHGMARLATLWRSVRPFLRHSFSEFAVMRVGVATGA